MQQSSPINSLKTLLSKALSLANSASISLIEKDMIMALIRKSYEEANMLEIESSSIPEEQNKLAADPVIIPKPIPEATPEPIIIPEVLPAPVPFEFIEEVKITVPVAEQVVIAEPEIIQAESTVVAPVQSVDLSSPVMEEKLAPSPNFAELMEKVKPKEIVMPTQKIEEEDDEPMFFSDIRLEDMFDPKAASELSERLSASKIDNIVTAIGLNERIFTINELFEGNNDEFQDVCAHLRQLGSYAQAKSYLSTSVIDRYNWMAPDKFRKAKEFIKLARRLYI